MMSVSFFGFPYASSTLHSVFLSTVLKSLENSMKTMYSGRYCSMAFSSSCHRMNIMSTVVSCEPIR